MGRTQDIEHIAKKVLDIYICFDCRAGDVLHANNFSATLQKHGLTFEEFKHGLDVALQKGWIERIDDSRYRLTKKGYEATRFCFSTQITQAS